MSTFGKPNATGRSSGKLAAKERELIGPPPNEAWAFLPRDLIASDAMRGASIHCRKLIDCLLCEHCNHAGRENGNLIATYDQLVAWGIWRKKINGAIREAVERGLLVIMKRGGRYGEESCRTASRYRITWIGTINPRSKATNEWRRFKKKVISRVPTVGTVCHAENQRKVANV